MANELKNDPLYTTRMTTSQLCDVDKYTVNWLGFKSRKESLFFFCDMAKSGVLDELASNWRRK